MYFETQFYRVESPTKPKVDPNEWKLEVERVTPLLKVQIHNDNKDWRIHLEQMNTYRQVIYRGRFKDWNIFELTTLWVR